MDSKKQFLILNSLSYFLNPEIKSAWQKLVGVWFSKRFHFDHI